MSEKSIEQRYQAAQKLLTPHTRTAVLNGRPTVHWQGETVSYVRQIKNNGVVQETLVTVNTCTGKETLSSVSSAPKAVPLDEKTVSPNGAWALVNREHNLWLLGRSGEKRLTADGAEKCEYGTYLDI